MPRKPRQPSIADTAAAPGGVGAVDKALSILLAFQAGETRLTLTELANRTGLYKSTVSRLLASLEHAGFAQRATDSLTQGMWQLGPRISHLNAIYLASFSVEEFLRPALRELVAKTAETACFHVRQGRARLCLYREEFPLVNDTHPILGYLLDPDHGAGAHVLKAFGMQQAETKDPQERQRLAEIRRMGYYACVDDRAKGVAGISAPVFRSDGRLLGALTCRMPSERYNPNHIPAVISTAKSLCNRI
ncbi:MAG: helix-turn-helix domain-containing protein [Burkholderiales bacterium]|mgnify:CR=1 FL=1|nr:helix-turn-helix domain-containing protein [Burkholderiales bacterium]